MEHGTQRVATAEENESLGFLFRALRPGLIKIMKIDESLSDATEANHLSGEQQQKYKKEPNS